MPRVKGTASPIDSPSLSGIVPRVNPWTGKGRDRVEKLLSKHAGWIIAMLTALAAVGVRAAVSPLEARLTATEVKIEAQEKRLDRMANQVDYLYQQAGGPPIRK